MRHGDYSTWPRRTGIFGQTARECTYRLQRCNEESTAPGWLRGPEMATAIGEFVERMLD